MTTALDIRQLSKTFSDTAAVREASLVVRSGQMVSLLGPSGCGKTTLLRLVAGFEWPDGGMITIAGRTVAGDGYQVSPEARRVGMVFQEYALFPHLTVRENISFGLRGSAKEKTVRTEQMLALVGLTGLDGRQPHELSGGQQQRVALARALAPSPDVLLLDEPFSNLDAALRTQVRAEVRSILKASGTTVIFVTHDQEEALSQADEVAVMFEGQIVQVAPPQQLYLEPLNRRVAAFVGEANFLVGEAHGRQVRCAVGTLNTTTTAQGKVEVLLRPEVIHIDHGEQSNAGDAPRATIRWREFYGHDQRVGLSLADGTRLVARLDARFRFDIGDAVTIAVNTPVQVYPAT
jgi:iron(III) transport system ATP-binding protein